MGRSPRDRPRGGHYAKAIARLAPGTTLDEAQRDVRGVAEQLATEYAENDGRYLSPDEDPLNTSLLSGDDSTIRIVGVLGEVIEEGVEEAVGPGLAFAMGGAMSGILIGVSPSDPSVFGGVTLVLAAVSFVGLYLPARRVSRTDPVQALTAD